MFILSDWQVVKSSVTLCWICCKIDTNITLYGNYTPIKTNKQKTPPKQKHRVGEAVTTHTLICCLQEGKLVWFLWRAIWYPLLKYEVNILRNFTSRNLSLRWTHTCTQRWTLKDIVKSLVLPKTLWEM